jgi:hypothetical protein
VSFARSVDSAEWRDSEQALICRHRLSIAMIRRDRSAQTQKSESHVQPKLPSRGFWVQLNSEPWEQPELKIHKNYRTEP